MQIFENAEFISCEDQNRIFQVMVEDRGRIEFTGNHLPETFRAVPTRIDLQGRCILPAFADTHMHFESFAFFRSTFDVRHVQNFAELADIVREYEQNHPRDKVILGFGVSAHTVEERQLPDRIRLDHITTRPLCIVKYDGHAAVANTALLEKLPRSVTAQAGFDKTTGGLYQQAYYDAVNHLTRSISLYQVLKNLLGASDELAKRGFGLIHTVEGLGFPLDADIDLMRFAARGLPLQYRIYFQTTEVRKVIRRNLPRIGGCFATALDGCFGTEDAALSEPYTNDPANRGFLAYSQQQVNAFVKEANRLGLQVSMHAIGDAAVEQAIIAYEAALADFPRQDHRHVIIHASLMPPPLLERAARIGIHIAIQPPLLHWDQEPLSYLTHILGKRACRLMTCKSMLDYGLTIAGGSDAPCSYPDAIRGIHTACNHPNPDQRISALDALRMYTHWAARLSFDENERGTLTPGKVADFVVLDKNPLAVKPEHLKDIKVMNLYLKGRPYEPPPRSPSDLCRRALKNILLKRYS
ncbi:MAG: amidohydrolase [Pseudomonadota bacterium]